MTTIGGKAYIAVEDLIQFGDKALKEAGYISTKEAAEKWGIRLDYVLQLIKRRNIPGVIRLGEAPHCRVYIPKDTEKPVIRTYMKKEGESCKDIISAAFSLLKEA